MRLGNDILSYLKYKYETLLGADHLTFDGMGGGGGDFNKKILQGNSEKIPALTTWRKKYPTQYFFGKIVLPH